MMDDFYRESESHGRAGELMHGVFRETFGQTSARSANDM
jgi:hypothetical protein